MHNIQNIRKKLCSFYTRNNDVTIKVVDAQMAKNYTCTPLVELFFLKVRKEICLKSHIID